MYVRMYVYMYVNMHASDTVCTKGSTHLHICEYTHVRIYVHMYVYKRVHMCIINKNLRGSADKSLARPGRKQATVTKLGIYSTYFPRSSIRFLARYSNFGKPLKNIQKIVRPTRSPRQQ